MEPSCDRAQRQAIGELATALVAVAKAVSEGQLTVVPEVLVTGGSSLDGLAASVVQALRSGSLGPPAPEVEAA